MDLNYSDEQVALRDSAQRFLKERYTADARRTPGSRWPALSELGWLGLVLRPEDGGLGGDMVDAGLIAEAMGRHLVVEPFVSSIILGAGLVAAVATPQQREKLLPEILAGRIKLALAHEEAGHGPYAASVTTSISGDGANATLNGAKTNVVDAGVATSFLVTARRADGRIAVGLCALDAAGLAQQPFPAVDGRMAARLTLKDTPVTLLGDTKDAGAAIDLVVDQAIAVLAADMLGAMEAALAATVAYAKMRVQFGQPIGANQVVKHRLVDMAVKCEEARSITLRALIRAGDGSDAATRARAVSAAKVKVAKSSRTVAEEAIQFHGGMGVTDELEIGGYLKRALAFEAVLGTSRWHKARYGALGRTMEERS